MLLITVFKCYEEHLQYFSVSWTITMSARLGWAIITNTVVNKVAIFYDTFLSFFNTFKLFFYLLFFILLFVLNCSLLYWFLFSLQNLCILAWLVFLLLTKKTQSLNFLLLWFSLTCLKLCFHFPWLSTTLSFDSLWL
jgi:hypothetical protein